MWHPRALFLPLTLLLCGHAALATETNSRPGSYFDQTGRGDVLAGGVRLITVQTPKGPFRVWTKRVGNNPRIKVLLLHGGPGATHEYFEALDSYFPGAGIEYYYYDQLGSAYSDQPDQPELWALPRFVEEVEQVRQALRLEKDNFYLLGHSWGGILALEYALKYQQHLKGLIISNMVPSIPAYNRYAREVLIPAMDPKVLAEIQGLEAAGKYEDPRYEELLLNNFYNQHILRMPPDRVARSGIARFRQDQQEDLHPDAGAERNGRERQTGRLGPDRRSGEDHRPDTRDRGAPRYHGARADEADRQARSPGPLPLLSERQPSCDLR